MRDTPPPHPATSPHTLRALTDAILNDPAVAARNPERLTYVARFNRGVANEFGFFYAADGSAEYWAPEEWDALDLAQELHRHATPQSKQMVLILRLSRPEHETRLTVLHDADAEPWFVPLGHEDALAAMAR